MGLSHGAQAVMVVLAMDGEYWGLDDWRNSEGERGINTCYRLTDSIELYPVEMVVTHTYQRRSQ